MNVKHSLRAAKEYIRNYTMNTAAVARLQALGLLVIILGMVYDIWAIQRGLPSQKAITATTSTAISVGVFVLLLSLIPLAFAYLSFILNRIDARQDNAGKQATK